MTDRRFIPAFAAAVLAVACVAPLPAAELSTLTGKKYTGEFGGITAGVLTFQTTTGSVGVAVTDIYMVNLGNPVSVPAKDAKWDEVELVDGSVLRCEEFKVRGKQVELSGGAFKVPTRVPLEAVFSLCRGGQDATKKQAWKSLVAGRGKRDMFVVRRGDTLNPVAGTVLEGNEAGDAISFEQEDGQKVTFKLIRATGGLVFNQPPRGVIPPTLCKVHDATGNVWTAQAVEAVAGGVKVTAVSGATITYPNWKALSKLDFSQGNIAFLSDLDPQVSAPDPAADSPQFTYFRDRTDENGPLKLDGQSFAKGLWLAPDTGLTFKLNGDYREFKAVIGVDDSAREA